MTGQGQPSTSGSGGASVPSTSGRSIAAHHLPSFYYAAGQQPSTTQLALTIAGAAVAGAVVWHFTRETYYSYVPPKVRGGLAQSLGSAARRDDGIARVS